MGRSIQLRRLRHPVMFVAAMALFGSMSCSTAPKAEKQPEFLAEARAKQQWFEEKVPGLHNQISNSAGYIVFPDIGQWGILFTGGKFGRGMVCDNKGNQVGWGAINTGSLGLQAGIQGLKMLVVFQDQETFDKFKQNQLSGSANATAVIGDQGGYVPINFDHGVAVYQAANKGLMAGVNLALDYMRFKPLGAE